VTYRFDSVVVAWQALEATIPVDRLHPLEQQLLATAGSDARRRELLAGRVAAHRALEALGAPAGLAVITDTSGRPMIQPAGAWHVSLAHDGLYALAAASTQAVGVDLITLDRAAQAGRVVTHRIETGRARGFAAGARCPWDAALMLWTAWEALGKRTGEGVLAGAAVHALALEETRGPVPTALAGAARLHWFLVDDRHLACVAGAAA
jgi:4'-phosphopantetheinyl transferase EntD